MQLSNENKKQEKEKKQTSNSSSSSAASASSPSSSKRPLRSATDVITFVDWERVCLFSDELTILHLSGVSKILQEICAREEVWEYRLEEQLKVLTQKKENKSNNSFDEFRCEHGDDDDDEFSADSLFGPSSDLVLSFVNSPKTLARFQRVLESTPLSSPAFTKNHLFHKCLLANFLPDMSSSLRSNPLSAALLKEGEQNSTNPKFPTSPFFFFASSSSSSSSPSSSSSFAVPDSLTTNFFLTPSPEEIQARYESLDQLAHELTCEQDVSILISKALQDLGRAFLQSLFFLNSAVYEKQKLGDDYYLMKIPTSPLQHLPVWSSQYNYNLQLLPSSFSHLADVLFREKIMKKLFAIAYENTKIHNNAVSLKEKIFHRERVSVPKQIFSSSICNREIFGDIFRAVCYYFIFNLVVVMYFVPYLKLGASLNKDSQAGETTAATTNNATSSSSSLLSSSGFSVFLTMFLEALLIYPGSRFAASGTTAATGTSQQQQPNFVLPPSLTSLLPVSLQPLLLRVLSYEKYLVVFPFALIYVIFWVALPMLKKKRTPANNNNYNPATSLASSSSSSSSMYTSLATTSSFEQPLSSKLVRFFIFFPFALVCSSVATIPKIFASAFLRRIFGCFAVLGLQVAYHSIFTSSPAGYESESYYHRAYRVINLQNSAHLAFWLTSQQTVDMLQKKARYQKQGNFIFSTVFSIFLWLCLYEMQATLNNAVSLTSLPSSASSSSSSSSTSSYVSLLVATLKALVPSRNCFLEIFLKSLILNLPLQICHVSYEATTFDRTLFG